MVPVGARVGDIVSSQHGRAGYHTDWASGASGYYTVQSGASIQICTWRIRMDTEYFTTVIVFHLSTLARLLHSIANRPPQLTPFSILI